MDEQTRDRYASAIVDLEAAIESGRVYCSAGSDDGVVENGAAIDYLFSLREAMNSAKRFRGDPFLDAQRQRLSREFNEVYKRLSK